MLLNLQCTGSFLENQPRTRGFFRFLFSIYIISYKKCFLFKKNSKLELKFILNQKDSFLTVSSSFFVEISEKSNKHERVEFFQFFFKCLK